MKLSDFVQCIKDSIENAEDNEMLQGIETFEEAGFITRDKGLVVTMDDGSEFTLSIQQTEHAADGSDEE